MQTDCEIYVVDDDNAVLEALSSLIRSISLNVVCFSSAEEFLATITNQKHGCLILDIRMPELSGLDVQRELKRRSSNLPIIFISGHGDIPMAVNAIKDGAIDFLTKPFREEELLNAIRTALKIEFIKAEQDEERDCIRNRFDTLSDREKQILTMVLNGYPNKTTAYELSISEATVKVHRHNIMKKMEANSLPELTRNMEKIKLHVN